MKSVKMPPAKNKKKAIVLTTLAVSAAGILGYFGWQYYKKKKEKKSELPADMMQPQNKMPELQMVVLAITQLLHPAWYIF